MPGQRRRFRIRRWPSCRLAASPCRWLLSGSRSSRKGTEPTSALPPPATSEWRAPAEAVVLAESSAPGPLGAIGPIDLTLPIAGAIVVFIGLGAFAILRSPDSD